METNNLLVAFFLLVAFLLARCGAEEAPVLEVPEGAQAGDLTVLKG